MNEELSKTGKFEVMDETVDEEEHSIEMQLSYLRLVILACSLLPKSPPFSRPFSLQ
jgi:predicted class III extradiol MEMO1 family dioxygenase